MERTGEPQEEKQAKRISNHANLEAASPHESSSSAGQRIKVFVEKGGSEGLRIFQAETVPAPRIHFKQVDICKPNPYKVCLCKVALRPYKTFEMWYYSNNPKPYIAMAINQEYGFLDENRLKQVYLAAREGLRWLKTRKAARNKLLDANIILGICSCKAKPQKASLKPKPRVEVHGTIRQCVLCHKQPVVRAITETTDEHDKPLKIINYFCSEHWSREASKTLYTKAERINKNTMPHGITLG